MDGTSADARDCAADILHTLHGLYGCNADRLEIAALTHAENGDLARYVGYSAQADDFRILEQKARAHHAE